MLHVVKPHLNFELILKAVFRFHTTSLVAIDYQIMLATIDKIIFLFLYNNVDLIPS